MTITIHPSHPVVEGRREHAWCHDCGACCDTLADPCSGSCSCPSGDGSLRWPCLVHPPADVEPVEDLLPELPPTPADTVAAAGAALGRAVDEFVTALVEALRPVAEVVMEAVSTALDRMAELGEYLRRDRPVRWLNRRARREAMRRHPAGKRIPPARFSEAVTRLDLAAADVGQPDAGELPTPAELAACAGIRLPDLTAAEIEPLRLPDLEAQRFIDNWRVTTRYPVRHDPLSDMT